MNDDEILSFPAWTACIPNLNPVPTNTVLVQFAYIVQV